ncbi:hypothetical protein [Thalassotalea fusca]
MRKIIISFSLLSLFSFYSVADDEKHLELINGSWNCSDNFVDGEVSGTIKSKYIYDATKLAYEIHVTMEFTYLDNPPFGSISVTEKGRFSYNSAKMIYMPNSAKAKVLEDPFESFTDDMLTDMENELTAEDNTEYQTTSINKLEWETLDPTDNTKSVCFRDITSQ